MSDNPHFIEDPDAKRHYPPALAQIGGSQHPPKPHAPHWADETNRIALHIERALTGDQWPAIPPPYVYQPTKFNINTVPPQIIETFPHVGKSLTDRIIAQRNIRPFESGEDMRSRVKGLGPATWATMEPYIDFDNKATVETTLNDPPPRQPDRNPPAQGPPDNAFTRWENRTFKWLNDTFIGDQPLDSWTEYERAVQKALAERERRNHANNVLKDQIQRIKQQAQQRDAAAQQNNRTQQTLGDQ